jgi:K+-sensing histidine kinase KdpD
VPAEDNRPPPEYFLAITRAQQRGLLKFYIGFAGGVGKTYEMLQEGHRLKRQGMDVVIGVGPGLRGETGPGGERQPPKQWQPRAVRPDQRRCSCGLALGLDR